MARFVEGMDRGQVTLLPECLEEWVHENNPVRAVDVFVEALDLVELSPGVASAGVSSTGGSATPVVIDCSAWLSFFEENAARRMTRMGTKTINHFGICYCPRTEPPSSNDPMVDFGSQ